MATEPRRGGLRSPTANRNRAAEADRVAQNELNRLDQQADADRNLVERSRGQYTSPMGRARYAPAWAAMSEGARQRALSNMASEPSDGPGAGNMMNRAPTAPPAIAPESPAQRPRPQGRRRTAPAAESMSADDLNEISLRLARGATPTTDTEKWLARAMGLNFKKGGLVPPMKKGAPRQTVAANGKTPPAAGKGPPPNMFKKARG